MKIRVLTAIAATTVLFSSCGDKTSSTGDLLTIDVTKSYPEKEIALDDIADVEYVALETRDDFLVDDNLLYIGKKIIALRNNKNHAISLFTRDGKIMNRIDRKGSGPQEYIETYKVACDEDRSEIYIARPEKNDILVYDFNGDFRRSLKTDSLPSLSDMASSRDNLLLYNDNYHSSDQSVTAISKDDGRVVKKIDYIPEAKVSRWVIKEAYFALIPALYPFTPTEQGESFLFRASCDTIYRMNNQGEISPVVARTPSIASMKDDPRFLTIIRETDRYIFLYAITRPSEDYQFDNPPRPLVYDKRDNKLYSYKIKTDDTLFDMPYYLVCSNIGKIIFNHTTSYDTGYQIISADAFWEMNEKGLLSGKAAEVAANITEDDNPIVMIVTLK